MHCCFNISCKDCYQFYRFETSSLLCMAFLLVHFTTKWGHISALIHMYDAFCKATEVKLLHCVLMSLLLHSDCTSLEYAVQSHNSNYLRKRLCGPVMLYNVEKLLPCW